MIMMSPLYALTKQCVIDTAYRLAVPTQHCAIYTVACRILFLSVGFMTIVKLCGFKMDTSSFIASIEKDNLMDCLISLVEMRDRLRLCNDFPILNYGVNILELLIGKRLNKINNLKNCYVIRELITINISKEWVGKQALKVGLHCFLNLSQAESRHVKYLLSDKESLNKMNFSRYYVPKVVTDLYLDLIGVLYVNTGYNIDLVEKFIFDKLEFLVYDGEEGFKSPQVEYNDICTVYNLKPIIKYNRWHTDGSIVIECGDVIGKGINKTKKKICNK
ncbi:unknown [Lettuce infectious yellows virus]|uniref:hypothetical protein n=1 Tax=Lettuce infectious yellows virus TaxID=31713 RepID=UPI00000EFC25|nr:hypothetical protein LIYVs1gp2 [Lettuce infectious yellows virus]AAA61799.1 unknown [Lettuce infectious yellows virus]prf//2113433C ORF [Lettuce infectious yellows virus]